MANILSIENWQKDCTGCLVCVDVCPKNCIEKTINQAGGYVYPSVNNELCINCGKCVEVCPVVHIKKHNEEQHMFAAYSKSHEELNAGSSGGIFGLLAKYCLKNGYYVCGAAFEGTKLKHRIISSANELKPLLKSKYIQSDTQGIYSNIMELLKSGNKVLFCGTPCQVSALNNFLPDNLREHLIMVDFVCHGVPSQKIFDMYIQDLEKKHKGKIESFSFRVKDNKFMDPHDCSYIIRRDKKIITKCSVRTLSTYYNAFGKYLILRDSCYNCMYATLSRCSDITLADFWNIERYEPQLDVQKGVSMVITNSTRGQSLYDCISEQIFSKQVPLNYGTDTNYALTKATAMPSERAEILESLNKNGYSKTANKYFKARLLKRIWWKLPAKFRKFAKSVLR